MTPIWIAPGVNLFRAGFARVFLRVGEICFPSPCSQKRFIARSDSDEATQLPRKPLWIASLRSQ
jgi:hypothetical protein